MKGFMVRAINKVLKMFRYRLVTLQHFTLACEALSREGGQVTFVQVGANDGVRFDDLFQKVTAGGWKGVVIEPIPEIFERLVANYRLNNKVIPLNIAIHPSKDSECVFFVNPESLDKYPDYAYGLGTMLKLHLLKHGVSESDIAQVRVPCQRLERVIVEHGLESLDVLQVDTEGFDYEVLRTLNFEQCRPRVIKFEWMNLTISDKEKARYLLEKAGYRLLIERSGSDCVAIHKSSLKI